MKKRRRKIQDWVKTAVIEAYKAGEKVTAIQVEFDLCGPSHVTKIVRRAGVLLRGSARSGRPVGTKRQQYLRRQQIAALRQQGLHR